MSQLELILSRLSGVRSSPNNNYQANCPCGYHSKVNNGKLYLKDSGEMVLMDCKSGCTAIEVLFEIELTLKDLYPQLSPVDKSAWQERQVIKAIAQKKDDDALKLWTMITILEQTLKARIFNNDDHPSCRNDLWDKEKEAVRMLPKYFKRYYK